MSASHIWQLSAAVGMATPVRAKTKKLTVNLHRDARASEQEKGQLHARIIGKRNMELLSPAVLCQLRANQQRYRGRQMHTAHTHTHTVFSVC